MKAGGERRRLCLRKSALAGSWSCVSRYLPGACVLSLLSGRAGLWAARALAALMGSVRARWQADGSRLPLRPHLPGHVPDMHACLRDVLLFLCVRFAPVVAAHCTARSSAAPSAPLFLLSNGLGRARPACSNSREPARTDGESGRACGASDSGDMASDDEQRGSSGEVRRRPLQDE